MISNKAPFACCSSCPACHHCMVAAMAEHICHVLHRRLSAQQQAQQVHAAATELGARLLPPAPALVEGSHRLRTAFLAAVFRARRGLAPDAASLEELREGALSVCSDFCSARVPTRACNTKVDTSCRDLPCRKEPTCCTNISLCRIPAAPAGCMTDLFKLPSSVSVQRQDTDEASTREERTFRMWLNSLLPRDRHISSDLSNDLRDGFALLSALDVVLPGSVDVRPVVDHCALHTSLALSGSPAAIFTACCAGLQIPLADTLLLQCHLWIDGRGAEHCAADALAAVQWRKVHQPPFKPLYRRPKSIENCNLAMAVMRDRMRLQLVNIGGEDIVNAEGKLIRALLWQLMRCEASRPSCCHRFKIICSRECCSAIVRLHRLLR